ncbi:MAG: glycosyltransferase, partial [Candidatus Marinimicrobia bacterium]|nr:glycosyltransferase [Candidatus Neomarinimicrobiota bacterium]
MNILYGVAATGNGHISRSRILISELKKRGHNITVLFSGRDIKDLFDTEEFEPFIAKEGFTFKI